MSQKEENQMSHQSQEPNETDLKVVEAFPKEKEPDKPAHPFLEKNDITLLSIINPLLSPTAQKLTSFFINFATPEVYSPYNYNEFMSQYSNKPKNQSQDLLSSLVGLLSNQDSKNSLNPAILTTLLSMFNTKKED
jgi:hypothetical protein